MIANAPHRREASHGSGHLRFDTDGRLAWTAGDVAVLGVRPEHVGMSASALGLALGYPEFGDDVACARRGTGVDRTVRHDHVRVRLELEDGAAGGSVVALVVPVRRRVRPVFRTAGGPSSPAGRGGPADAPTSVPRARRLLRAIISAERRERIRIARMIHDDLQQVLTASALWVDHLLEEDADPQHVGQQVQALLREAAELSHSIPNVLAPPPARMGLVDALEQFAIHFSRRFGFQARVHLVGAPRSIPEEAALVLYEAVRELLFNVYKHAGVAEATVEIAFEPGGARVTVEDLGHGFDLTDQQRVEGFGLSQIRTRLRLIGGSLTLDTAAGRGTRATVWVLSSTEPPEA
ncbi:sensor histidine kinase [Rubrivirga marina]|uniref:histidine kinase n=1 Tax=Rubrivirga marina TaxID=1196024 RepID=A0A271IYD1_9BACT|nr:ATP-binding protein [Rubrivirga marina]PAP75968.1 hypothetical protein BSZ37_05695 [Rubrivirga marina]